VRLAESWTMDAHDELLRAAVDITRAASGLAAQRFLQGVPVGKKTDGTEVTPADIEVEELIRSLIAARFPGDGVTGEELADTPGTTGRRWVIDPIDGTSAFALRIPMFSVLLGVEDPEGSAVSVISYPMSQDLIYAGRGLGCWHQVNDDPPQRITVSSARQPRGAWVEMVNPATWSEELLVTLHREVLLLPDVKGMLGVASGQIDALIIAGLPMGYEDIAPIPLIIGEAGGRVSDLDGNDVLTIPLPENSRPARPGRDKNQRAPLLSLLPSARPCPGLAETRSRSPRTAARKNHGPFDLNKDGTGAAGSSGTQAS
jgi:histidinol-phosphatase